jgi:hypothetical protein
LLVRWQLETSEAEGHEENEKWEHLCIQKWEHSDNGLGRQECVAHMSTYHDTSMEKFVTIQVGGNRNKFKCQCVYLKHIGVDD